MRRCTYVGSVCWRQRAVAQRPLARHERVVEAILRQILLLGEMPASAGVSQGIPYELGLNEGPKPKRIAIPRERLVP